MKNYTFHFEVQTLIEQFIEAFNDVVIKRYDKNKNLIANSNIDVKYIYAPKQRILETLTNPSPGGITLPAIAVNINSIQRDPSRVVNKIEGYNIQYPISENFEATKKINHLPSPVPINIGISMNIFTKYQSDMDQIISNFLPYCDPYIIISWHLPIPDKEDNKIEIRTEVLFNNDVTLNYPDTLSGNQIFRCSASCSFVIKGWLFKTDGQDVPRIFNIETKFTPVGVAPSFQKYSLLKSIEDLNIYDKTIYSGFPYLRTVDKWGIDPDESTDFIELYLIGSNLDTSLNQLYLSASFPLQNTQTIDYFTDVQELSDTNPPFNGVLIPKTNYDIVNNNIIKLNLPLQSLKNKTGFINFLYVTEGGYANLVENYNEIQENFASSLNIPLEELAKPTTSGIQIY